MDHETTSRPPLQDRSQQQNLGGYEQIVRGRVEAFGNPSSSSSQQQQQQQQQTNPIDEATTKESEKPNNNNKPTAPLMLRHRPQPLPFILPQPLGPLPTPAQNALSMVPTVRRDFFPASLPPAEYQRDLERHPRPGPTNSGSGMRQPFPTFLPPPPPPPPDLTRRQSMGSLSSQSPYLPPPLPAYPRRSTSPAFRQSQQQLQQQQQYQQPPVLGSRASVGNLVGWSHHAPAFWPSPPSTSEGSAPGPGIPFPGPPPRPSPRAAEHVRFQCDQCPENFPTNGVLKRHKKTHSARKYRCGCGAAYTDKSVLRVSLKKLQEFREKHTQLKWGAKESNSS